MMDFGRLITAMVTPFDAQGAIEWETLGRLVDHLIEVQRNDAIIVCGTTGESPTLTDEEKAELFRYVVRRANGRCKVIAGTGSNSTAHTIHLTHEAEQAGVDGILLVAPYYNRPSQEGLYRHFSAVAASTKLPIMLYNIPGRTGINVEVSTTLRLAREFDHIVATKESITDFDAFTRLVAESPEHFRVYSGDDGITLPVLSVGGYGIVSVSSHIVGAQMKEMIEAYLAGRVADAAALHQKLSPVFSAMFNCPHRVPSPAPVKHALKLRGIDVGGLRLPLVGVTEAEGLFIEDVLNRFF